MALRRLTPLALFVSACGTWSIGAAPALPTGVAGEAGVEQVALRWDAVPGAVAYVVYVEQGAAALKTSPATQVGNVTSMVVGNLTGGQFYHFAVTALNRLGESALSREAIVVPLRRQLLGVSRVTPAERSTEVARNGEISVTFSRAVDPRSLSSDPSCGGSVQLSSDGFQTCAAADASLNASGRTLTLRQVTPLRPSSTYRLRVTAALKDLTGNGAVPFASKDGFTTAAELQATLAPAGALPVLRPDFSVAFNRHALDSTVRTNGVGHACTGSIQLSADGFVTCVPMTFSVFKNSVYLSLLEDLAFDTAYTLRVGGVLDTDSLPMAAPVAARVRTPPALSVTRVSPAGIDVDTHQLIELTFDRAPVAPLVTAAAGCTGTVALLEDATSTCVGLNAPVVSADGRIFSFAPPAPLQPATAYRLRIDRALRDANAVPMSATFTSKFVTGPPLDVVAIAPMDRSAAPLPTAPGFRFTRAIDAAGLTAGDGCNGSVRLTSAGSCVPLAAPFALGPLSWNVAPPLLGGAADYQLSIGPVRDANGNPQLEAPRSFMFRTVPALAAQSVTPVDQATLVGRSAILHVDFNRAAFGATAPQTIACGSSTLQLSADNFATCIPLGQPSGDGTASWSVAVQSALSARTSYRLRVSGNVLDPDGVSMRPQDGATVSFTTGDDLSGAAPSDPTGVTVARHLAALDLQWTNPASPDLAGVRISTRKAGAADWSSSSTFVAAPAAAATVSHLDRGTAYDVELVAVSRAGTQSAGVVVSNQATGFDGTAADFGAAESAPGEAGGSFYATWSASDVFAGFARPAAASLAPGEALWIAFDTDPATDATGEWETPTGNGGSILWPFKADVVVELANSSGTPVAGIRAGGTWSPLAARSLLLSPSMAAVQFPKSVLGSPSAVRIAFAALSPAGGTVFDVAPANSGATNTLQAWASLTSSLAAPAPLWSAARNAATALDSVEAAALVSVAIVNPAGFAGPVTIKGSLPPLDSRGDALGLTADRKVAFGRFNLGARAGPLIFRASAAGADEVVLRTVALTGGAQAVPTLLWNQPSF